MTNTYRRYTELPYLLQMLSSGKITLLSPSRWEDRNDAAFMEHYREQTHPNGSVVALCLTERTTTFHHWKVFAPGPSGVCIKFKKKEFIQWAKNHTIKISPVQYKSIDDLNAFQPETKDLPFIKRDIFKDEGEIRLLYESSAPASTAEFDLPASIIKEISLSPWLHDTAIPAVQAAIEAAAGSGADIKIKKNQILDNPKWLQILFDK